MNIAFYQQSDGLWVLQDADGNERYLPTSSCRLGVNGTKVTLRIIGEGDTIINGIDVTIIGKSVTPADYYTTISEFLTATSLFFKALDVEGIESELAYLNTNETIYQLFTFVGTSTTGQVTIPSQAQIFDKYNDGVIDAICVEADANDKPGENLSLDANGTIIQVTSLDVNGNYVLSATPSAGACVLYYIKIEDQYKQNVDLDYVVFSEKYIAFKLEHVINVAKAGGDYTSVKEAIDSITDNTSINRYTIRIAPGEYTVDNSLGAIALKDFCNITVIGLRSVILKPQDPATDMFIGAKFSHIEGIVFSGNTGATAYIINHSTVDGNTLIQDCVLRDCSNGFLLNNALASFEIYNLVLNNPLSTTTVAAIKITAGKANIRGFVARTTSKATTVIDISGATSFVNLADFISLGVDISTALQITDGAEVIGTSNNIGYCTDGMVVSGNNTLVRIDAFKILYCTNDGFRIENVGTGIKVDLFATTVSECENLNFNVLNTTCIVTGNGFTEMNKGYIVEGAKFYAYLLDISEDDEGLNILGELHVGTPETPAESVFGEGDSYTRAMLVYTYDGTSYVDVSEAAKSASGSTFTFPNVNVNSAIYIASTAVRDADYLQHYGIKLKNTVAAVLGAGNFIAEYWDGADWVETHYMETDSGGSYYPHAESIFENTGSHQLRYDAELINDTWTKNDPMTAGTSYYWMRFRIEVAITTAPIFEQFKIHSNRFEINSDGWIEYFGKARPIGQLSLNMTLGVPFEGNMQSQTLYLSENVGVGGQNNKFTAVGDKLGIAGFLPFDLDTSSKIKLAWSGLPSVSETIIWTVRWAWGTEGDPLSITEPAAITNSREITVSKALTINQVNVILAELDISKMVARRDGGFGDGLWISIQPSTMGGTFSLAGSQALYTKWCEGGHI